MFKKSKHRENFPVGLFVSSKLKNLVKSYYDVARFTDDIVDNPNISSKDKLAKLENISKAFLNPNGGADIMSVRRLGKLFVANNLDASLFMDLLVAFERDVNNKPIRIWEELIDYCRYSASPVGRFMLAIHDENPSAYMPAETLCVMLQIIDHLCDIKQDLSLLKRIYIPQDMLKRYNVNVNDLGLSYTTPEIASMLSEISSKLANMQADTAVLPSLVGNFLLRFEICVILSLTNSMIQKIKKTDILQKAPKLGFLTWAKAIIWGLAKAIKSKPLRQGHII